MQRITERPVKTNLVKVLPYNNHTIITWVKRKVVVPYFNGQSDIGVL